MGIMTLALSAFSFIPMAVMFVYRVFLARVVAHLLVELKNNQDGSKEQGMNHFESCLTVSQRPWMDIAKDKQLPDLHFLRAWQY